MLVNKRTAIGVAAATAGIVLLAALIWLANIESESGKLRETITQSEGLPKASVPDIPVRSAPSPRFDGH